jgi:hypothetical protein
LIRPPYPSNDPEKVVSSFVNTNPELYVMKMFLHVIYSSA